MKKDKYLQIFNYLLEFSKLRSNPVRDIEHSDKQYPEKIWFSDIPQYELFDCITFPNFNQDVDYWLRIAKPKGEPIPPTFAKVSDALTDWIVAESLTNENTTPVLNDAVIKNGKTISLVDKPEVQAEFQAYLNDKWIDDLECYNQKLEAYEAELAKFEKQSKTYRDLFSICNKAQQFGEEFELVVGVGLLHFQEDANSPVICRHILTSKAEITFVSARESFVEVSPSIENEIQIETDAILDLFGQFDSADIIEAERKVAEFLKNNNITDSPFDNQIKEAIQIFADRMRPDGQWKDDLAKSKVLAKKPTIFFAPALLLRKRNAKSFTALYERIIENITTANDSIDIPAINDIIGHFPSQEDRLPDFENGGSDSFVDDTIYFPKKYNDEQIEIIEKARRNSKVLVQGPPGTGKSHTIANLICHLLANGKKILVTAYTKRALEVLKNQLPTEFQRLTVNLLSGDSASIQDLDASVNAINDELSRTTNLDSYKEEIVKRELELFSLKSEKANTKNEWLKVKELAIRRQNINRIYQGTIAEIAERIEKERATFAWFKDEVVDIGVSDLVTEVGDFISHTRHYQSIDCEVFNFIIPRKEKLLLLSEIEEYRRISNELAQKYSSKEERITIFCNDYPELRKLLQSLYELYLEIENNALPFKVKIVNDYPNNIDIWNVKLSRSANTLIDLPDEKLKQLDRSVEVKYPKDKSLIQIKSDAEFLLQLLSEGKKLRGVLSVFNPFAPASVKQRKYFIQGVQVNGSDCDSEQGFKTVLADVEINQDFEELKSIWDIEPNGISKFYSDRALFYRKLKEDTDSLIVLLSEANKIKSQIESFSSLKVQDYDKGLVSRLMEEVECNFLISQAILIRAKIEDVKNHLSIKGIHPVATGIKEVFASIDVAKYEQYLTEIDNLTVDKEKYSRYKMLEEKLCRSFPRLLGEILENTFEVSKFGQLENAIHFKHAVSEVEKLLSDNYETQLSKELSDLERNEEKLISAIASRKAWLSVLDGLSTNFLLRQHLQAWVQAVKKIGKTGTGKRALKFRKEAQHQMDKCKDSVPCWVMPLYKVAETINPKQGMYDYVIIDEASQLGADAIFLLYISKNIIIVGDDKQTSPEYVGVDANTMTPHINRHLQNIPFANYYGTEFSFFDHAKRFCNGMTVLREHFRCMPEIIEFCNKYFYAPDGIGLYPLKQYSENRLEPLRSVYCQSGFVDGASQNIINKVEAEAIANKIAELIGSESYLGKSFGVIAMQGNKQATLIESLIIKKIGDVEFKRREIVCGASASFQGDERDIMFLSLVTAHNHNRSALTRPEDERRFNVAVSRAKEQVWLFHSVQLDDLSNTNDLRYKLLDHFLNYKPQLIPSQRTFERTLGTQPAPFESWFEVDVYNDIVTNNFTVIPQYEVAKGRYRIDLVALLSNGVKIAIECDGDKYHGPEQFVNDMMRQKVLERCGWQFFRVRGGEYYSNRRKALEPLWKILQSNEKKVDVSFLGNFEQKGDEEIIGEIVEAVEPESNWQSIVSGKKVEQPELSGMNSQVKMIFVKEREEPVIIKTSTDLFSFPEILVFTSRHNVYKVANRSFTTQSQVVSQIEFEAEERPIYFTGVKDYMGYLVVAFQNGKAAKISMAGFHTEHNRKKLKNAFSDESKLIFIEHIEYDIDLVAVSSINKVVLFNTRMINPVESRTTKGVQVMKQKDNSFMMKVKRLNQVTLRDAEYYRKDESLNVVGYYLKQGDEV
jgi:very-short-patch-repair endonuclease